MGGVVGKGGKCPATANRCSAYYRPRCCHVTLRISKLRVDGRLSKLTRGCAMGQRAEGCRWRFSDACSGCPVAQPRLPMQCLPGFDFLMSSARGRRWSRMMVCIRLCPATAGLMIALLEYVGHRAARSFFAQDAKHP
jgi:hypothetical protein